MNVKSTCPKSKGMIPIQKKKKKSSQEKKFEKDIQTVFHIERTPIKYGLLLHNIAVM